MVLDIGAHIGEFALHAIKQGAKHVVCVEPNPVSVALLRKNIAHVIPNYFEEPFTVVAAACVQRHRATAVRLRYRDRNTVGASITWKKEMADYQGIPYRYVEVPSVRLTDLLHTHKPSVIKIDAEGIEYELLEGLESLPSYVKAIAIEWHGLATKVVRRYIALDEWLYNQGFRPERESKLTLKLGRNNEIIGSNRRLLEPICWTR